MQEAEAMLVALAVPTEGQVVPGMPVEPEVEEELVGLALGKIAQHVE